MHVPPRHGQRGGVKLFNIIIIVLVLLAGCFVVPRLATRYNMQSCRHLQPGVCRGFQPRCCPQLVQLSWTAQVPIEPVSQLRPSHRWSPDLEAGSLSLIGPNHGVLHVVQGHDLPLDTLYSVQFKACSVLAQHAHNLCKSE
jgi:hypothetical protein